MIQHGGKRAGSGRKKKNFSEDQIESMLETAKKFEIEFGLSLDDILLGIAYKPESTNREKIAAIKIFKEHTKPISRNEEINSNLPSGPVIGLPELKPIENIVKI